MKTPGKTAKPPLLSALCISLALAWSAPASASTPTEQIQALIAQEKFQQALDLSEQQADQDGDNLARRFLKALLLTKLHRLEEARVLFMGLTLTHPELPEPYNNLAVIYAAQGRFDSAREALRQALHTHPSYATAHENMGDIYAGMAALAYSEALQLGGDRQGRVAKLSLMEDLLSLKTGAQLEEETGAEGKKPAPQQATSQPVSKEPVLRAVRDWAALWSAQDADAYLATYAREFIPEHERNQSQWQAQRRQRLREPRFIKIGLEEMKVEFYGDEHALVRFTQSYESDSHRDRSGKTLLMKNIGGRWRIVEERSD